MKSRIEELFSAAELESVRRTAEAAEEGTSGEVVTYVVERCDSYSGTCWKAAAVTAVATALVAGAGHQLGGFWGGAALWWISLPVLAAAVVGYGAVRFLPALRRALTSPAVLELRCSRRAATAFLEEEVFRTRDRTGILIFLALFEHRVVILADSGIHARVEAERWDALAAELAAGIKAGRAAAALRDTVEQCGRLLAAGGVERRVDDTNELSDHVRLRRE